MEKNLISNLSSLPVCLPENDYIPQSIILDENSFNYNYISPYILSDLKFEKHYTRKDYYDLNGNNNINLNNIDNEKLINIMFKEKNHYEEEENENKEDDIKTKLETSLMNLKRENNEIINDHNSKEMLYIEFKVSEQEKIFTKFNWMIKNFNPINKK